MNVVDHRPAAWHLLRWDDAYLLDTLVSMSKVDYTLLIQLTPDEYREYHALGRVFIDYLAARISCWPHEYQPRDLPPQEQTTAHEVIMAWQRSQPGG